MKIALIGYGKMGKEIEKFILEEGRHQVGLIISEENIHEFTPENLAKVDIAIEFTHPDAAYVNVMRCFAAHLPVVVGTTSWDSESAIRVCKERDQTLFVSPNFSIGVNLFFKLNIHLAKMMASQSEYNLSMTEIHHKEKKDVPSGTASKLANDIIQLNLQHHSWSLDSRKSKDEIPIKVIREEGVHGTHHVRYESDIDFIEISHEAKSRRGFAVGAVRAAEFIYGKKGFYTMDDLLSMDQ